MNMGMQLLFRAFLTGVVKQTAVTVFKLQNDIVY